MRPFVTLGAGFAFFEGASGDGDALRFFPPFFPSNRSIHQKLTAYVQGIHSPSTSTLPPLPFLIPERIAAQLSLYVRLGHNSQFHGVIDTYRRAQP